MAVEFIESFDHLSIATMPYKWDSVVGVPTISAAGRTVNCLSVNATGIYLTKTLSHVRDTWIIGFALKPSAGTRTFIMGFTIAGEAQVGLVLNANNTLSAVRPTINGWNLTDIVVLATTTATVVEGAWNYIEFKVVISAAAGSIEIRIDNIASTASGLNTKYSASVGADGILIGEIFSTVAYRTLLYDDLYIIDTLVAPNDNFLGMDKRVSALFPIGKGNSDSWLRGETTPTQIAQNSGWAAGHVHVDINTDGNILEGDFLVAFCTHNELNGATIDGVGWTELDHTVLVGCETYVWYKRWHAGDLTVYTFSAVAAYGYVAGFIRKFRAVNTLTPIDTWAKHNGVATLISFPSILLDDAFRIVIGLAVNLGSLWNGTSPPNWISAAAQNATGMRPRTNIILTLPAGLMDDALFGDITLNSWIGYTIVLRGEYGCTASWQCVDDAVPDNDVTEVHSITKDHIDTHVVDDLPIAALSVVSVQTNIITKRIGTGTSTIAPIVRSIITDRVGTPVTLTADYLDRRQIYDLNPETAAHWDVTDINNAEFGYKKIN